MTQNVGDFTTLFKGTQSENGTKCESAVDYIAVNGLCTNDKEPWATAGRRCWFEDYLLKPDTRVLLASNPLNSKSTIGDLLGRGEHLLQVIDGFVPHPVVPVIFLCFGLGGIILLQALSLSKGRPSEEKLVSAIAGVVFFGTPLVCQQLDNFAKSLRDCFTAELLIGRHDTEVEVGVAEEIRHLLVSFGYWKFDVISCYERNEQVWHSRLRRSKKTIITQDLAKLANFPCLGLDRDHHTIAKIDSISFMSIEKYLKNMLENYSKAGNRKPQPPDPIHSLSAQNSSATQYGGPAPPESGVNTPDAVLGVGSARQTQTQDTAAVAVRPEPAALNLPLHKIDLLQNPQFVGRDDILTDIKEELVTGPGSDRSKRAFAIYGTAGVGKTQTALKFAYDHKAIFKSILWASAETPTKLLQSLSEYGKLLGLVRKPADPATDAAVLMRWYQTTDTPWLLIFDNAVDLTILDYWPLSKSGAVLITTQMPIFAETHLCGKGKELLQLDPISAIKFLQSSLSQKSTDEEAARKIVARVGYLPVAIRTCIGQINEAECTLEDYNNEWNDERAIIIDSKVRHVESLDARYSRPLQDLWAKSVKDLWEHARSLFNVFSLLDDEHIPEELLINPSLHEQLPFLEHRVRALRDLTAGPLLGKEISEPGTPRRFHTHRLTRVFAQMQMDSNSRQAAFDAAALLLNAVVEGKSAQPNFFNVNKTYFQHVQALRDYYESVVDGKHYGSKSQDRESNTDGALDHTRTLVATYAFVQLLRKMSWWCYRVNFFGPALAFIETITKFKHPKERAIDPKDINLVETEMVWNDYQHGSIQTELGGFDKAERYFKSALKGRVAAEEKRQYDLPRLYAIYGGLGNSYNGLGLQTKSEEFFKKSLSLKPATEEFSNYETNICISLWAQGQHRLAEASQRLEDFIRRRKEKYGPEDTVDYLSGRAFYILGNVRKSQAEDIMITNEKRNQYYNEAQDYHFKSLKLWRATHGEEHHLTADAHVRCAWHSTRNNDHEAATESLERALKIYQNPSNRDYRKAERARTHFMLNVAYKKRGEMSKADDNRSQAEAIRKDILGDKYHPAAGMQSYDSLVSTWGL